MARREFTIRILAGMRPMAEAFQEYLNELMAKHDELASSGGAAVDYGAVEVDARAHLEEFVRRFEEGSLGSNAGPKKGKARPMR